MQQEDAAATHPKDDLMGDRNGRLAVRVLLAGAVLLVIASLTCFAVSEHAYLAHGVSTAARVTDVQSRIVGYQRGGGTAAGKRPIFEHHLLYRYRDGRGETFPGDFAVTSTAEAPPWRQQPGDAVAVEYLENDPATHRLPALAPAPLVSWGWLLLVLAVGAVLVTVAVWWAGTEALVGLVSWVGGSRAGFRTRRRRARLLREPFPDAWLEVLHRNVAAYGRLTPAEQQRLRDDLRVLIAERKWEGCAGLVLTDEIKVTVAAQACVLLLGIEHDYFSRVPSILVYPSAFEARGPHGGLEGGVPALGQAWYRGPVLLAWDEALRDGRHDREGRNVVHHEFAHQLDFLGEWPDRSGRPWSRSRLQRWRRVMREEYEALVEASEQGRATLLDQYGATAPTEFFAVATECFFSRPEALEGRHPRLYEVLRDYYGQDPAARLAGR
jgi:Mlc titration factor MtfA (ptsG expression regulator)